ncbi:glycosyltransferase family A protein [Bacteroides fragilis]
MTIQKYSDFEIILVDQNLDDRLISLVEKYSNSLNIVHYRSIIKGLSANRNIGIKIAKVILFVFLMMIVFMIEQLCKMCIFFCQTS